MRPLGQPGDGRLVVPAVRPDRVREAAEGDEALVVALLVPVVDRRAREESRAVVLVGLRVRDARVRAEGRAAVRRAREVDVRLETAARRVVARVVEGDVDVTAVTASVESQWLKRSTPGRASVTALVGAPRRAPVVREREEDVGEAGGREVHPRAGQPPAVRAGRAVGVARRVDEGARNCSAGNVQLERGRLRRDRPRRSPRDAAVEGAVEDDRVRGVVVPGGIDLAAGPTNGTAPIALPGPFGSSMRTVVNVAPWSVERAKRTPPPVEPPEAASHAT